MRYIGCQRVTVAMNAVLIVRAYATQLMLICKAICQAEERMSPTISAVDALIDSDWRYKVIDMLQQLHPAQSSKA